MKKVLFFILITIFIIPVLSYSDEINKPVEFEDKNKDAQFIFLLDSIDVKVNEDWSYVSREHKIVKILKEDAKDMGEVPIRYQSGVDKVTQIKAFTITPDGKKHRYTKIQDIKINDGLQMYSDAMAKIITLPEVNIGSILDNEYMITSKGLPMEKAFWYNMTIGSPAPTKELRFSITFPKKLGIQYKAFGLTQEPKITETAVDMTYSWLVNDINGADMQEDYLPPPTPESFSESIEFSSIPNWSDVSKWYFSLMKKNVIITPEMIKIVQGLIADKETTKDKTNAIKEYIQDNFRYVSMSFGNNSMEPHPTDQVFDNKYGDCKDLSLLTSALLKVAGVEAHVALFNQEFSINDPSFDLPVPSLFDHAVVLVKDTKEGDFYIDPVLKDYDIDQYPVNYQGAYTFIITEDGGKMDKLPIFDEQRNCSMQKMDITIGADGSSTNKTETISDLDSSIAVRQKLNILDKKEKDNFFETLVNYVAGNGSMIEWQIDGINKKYDTLKYNSVVKHNDDYPVTDDIMVIDITGWDRSLDFTSKDRENPIFYPLNTINKETAVYHIPPGFDVYYMPKNVDLDIGFFNIKRNYVHTGNEIKIDEISRYKRIQLPKEDYLKVKDFFDKLPGKTQQRIILRKKS